MHHTSLAQKGLRDAIGLSESLAHGILADMARILFLRQFGIAFWLHSVVLCAAMPVIADDKASFEDALGENDYVAALRVGEKLATAGDPRAQYVLGTMYVQGKGVAQDVIEGTAWLKKAASQNNTEALGMLSLLNYWGAIPNSSNLDGWIYAAKAVELGNKDALDLEARHFVELNDNEIKQGYVIIEDWAESMGIRLPWIKP